MPKNVDSNLECDRLPHCVFFLKITTFTNKLNDYELKRTLCIKYIKVLNKFKLF